MRPRGCNAARKKKRPLKITVQQEHAKEELRCSRSCRMTTRIGVGRNDGIIVIIALFIASIYHYRKVRPK